MLHMYEDDFLQIQKKGENMKKKLVKKALVLCLAFSMLAGTLSVPAAFVNDPSGFEVNSAAVKSENADIGESTEFVNDVQMRDQEEAAAGEIGSDARVRTVHRTESFLREATGLLQVPETEGSAEAQEAGTTPESATSDSAEGTDSTAVAEEDSDVVNVKNEAAAESNALEGENVAAAGQKPIETEVMPKETVSLAGNNVLTDGKVPAGSDALADSETPVGSEVPADSEILTESLEDTAAAPLVAEETTISADIASPVSIMAAPEEATVLGVTQTVHYMTVQYLLVEEGTVPADADAQTVWADYSDSVMGGFSESVEIYDADPESEYLSAIVSTSRLNNTSGSGVATFTDENTTNPTVYDFCTYDAEYGVAYIPRSFYFDENGEECMRSLCCEIVVPVNVSENPSADIEVFMDSTTDEVDLVGDHIVSAPIFDLSVTFPLTTPETAPDFDMSRATIYVNNSYVPYMPDQYYFNVETGELTLDLCSQSVYNIYVVYGKVNQMYEVMPLAAGSVADVAKLSNDILRMDLGDSSISAGDSFSYTNTMYYAAGSTSNATVSATFEALFGSGKSGWSAISPYCYAASTDQLNSYLAQWVQKSGSHGSDSTSGIIGVLGNAIEVGAERYHNFAYSLPVQGTVFSNGSHSFKFDIQKYNYLYGKCIENATGIDQISVDWGAVGSYEYALATNTISIRVLAVDNTNKTVTLAFSAKGFRNASQASVGIYKVEFGKNPPPPSSWTMNATVVFRIRKTDASNGAYISDAVFGLYKGNSTSSGNLLHNFTYQNNGVYLSNGVVYSGTPQYTVYESTVPSGYNTTSRLKQTVQLESPFNLYIETLYQVFLKRKSDAAGKRDWYNAIVNDKKSWYDIVHGFTSSAEFTKRNVSDEEFVNECYLAILLRNADSSGLSSYTNMVKTSGRNAVVKALVGTGEAQSALTNGKVGNSPGYQYMIDSAATNTPYYGNISVTKGRSSGYDSYASDFGSKLSLKGAEYSIYSSESDAKNNKNAITKMVTNADGKATSRSLKVGTYYIKETKVPTGYALDSTIYTRSVQLAGTTVISPSMEVSDTPQVGRIKVTKITDAAYQDYVKDHGSDYSLSGAVFRVYTDKAATAPLKTDGGTIVSITTGSDGTGTSRLIPPGTYYVKEYQAPKGHSLNETIMEVVVTAGTSTATPIGVTIANKPTISYLNLKKSSSNPTLTNNNSCYSLAGAVYQVYKDVACKVPVEGAVLTTNEEGISNTVDLIPSYYWVKEITAPDGFKLDSNPIKVDVTVGKTTTAPVQLTVTDEPLSDPGAIELTKIEDEEAKAYRESLGLDIIPLAGAQFEVKYYAGYYDTVAELPSTPTRRWVIETKAEVVNGETKYRAGFEDQYIVKGSKSDAFYRNSKGESVIPLGTITIKEVKAADGYTMANGFLDVAGTHYSDIYIQKIEDENSGIFIGAANPNAANVSNAPFFGDIVVTKVADTSDANNGKKLTGAEFTLYEWNGTEYTEKAKLKDQGDGTYTSDRVFYTTQNEGKFRVVETKAPDGYMAVADPWDFVLTKDTQSYTYTFKNPYGFHYKFVKVDPDHGNKKVAGCSFELRDKNGNVLDSWVTDGKTDHEYIGPMVLGETYTLVETGTPRWYRPMINQTFVAQNSKDAITVTSQNYPYRGRLFIQKMSAQGNPEGTTYQLYSTKVIYRAQTYKYDGKTFYKLEERRAGAGGILSFQDLELWNANQKQYEFLLIETSAPEGTNLLKDPIYIGTLPRTEKSYDDSVLKKFTGAMADPTLVNYEQRDGEYLIYDVCYEINNDTLFELPLTGSSSGMRSLALIPVGIGLGTGLVMFRRKKKTPVKSE